MARNIGQKGDPYEGGVSVDDLYDENGNLKPIGERAKGFVPNFTTPQEGSNYGMKQTMQLIEEALLTGGDIREVRRH